MFLDIPEEASAFYGQRLRKKIGKDIFNENHYLEPYFISSVVHYELFKLLKNKTDSVTYRFHMLMIIKYLILGNCKLSFEHEDIKNQSEDILRIVQRKTVFPKYIKKANEIIDEVISESEYEYKDANKKKGFRELVQEKSKAINFNHRNI